jgi:hypothetical protein
MPLLGPMVVIAETSAADLVDVLGAAGAFPIVETSWAHAPLAIAEIQPVALALADPNGEPSERHVRAVAECLANRGGPITPVIALVDGDRPPALPEALSIALDDSTDRLVARLRSALRVRTTHATVLRRARAVEPKRQVCIPEDILAQATVLCVGRGGSFPVLSVAIGEQLGVVGAFSIDAAVHYLNARDIDGIVIGDGLGSRAVSALLITLAEESRFRDLPVGLLNNSACDEERLPNLIRAGSDAIALVERVLAFVRLQAFETHLRRMLKALDSEGMIDPETGLLLPCMFWRDLDRTIDDASKSGRALSIARFSFDGIADRHAFLDAARLFSRLVRNIDFACRDEDGSILAAFTETDLRSAHVVARRMANVLRQTMVSPGHDRRGIRPNVTLASLRSTDDLSTLVARVGTHPRSPPRQRTVSKPPLHTLRGERDG